MADTKPLAVATMLGSLRKGSFNAAVLRAASQSAPAGMTFAALPSIRELPIYDADIQAEGFPAPVEAMADAIRAADGLLIVTPEYNYSIPGGLKNAIDWLSRLPQQPFAGKPIALMTASMGGLGGARCQYHLRQAMVFLDGHVMNKPEVMVPAVHTKIDKETGELTDAATKQLIAQHLINFAAYIERLR
ncbi:MAG: NADPH-dependent FMN reductase [Alphaproteobacteria bacterium]